MNRGMKNPLTVFQELVGEQKLYYISKGKTAEAVKHLRIISMGWVIFSLIVGMKKHIADNVSHGVNLLNWFSVLTMPQLLDLPGEEPQWPSLTSCDNECSDINTVPAIFTLLRCIFLPTPPTVLTRQNQKKTFITLCILFRWSSVQWPFSYHNSLFLDLGMKHILSIR